MEQLLPLLTDPRVLAMISPIVTALVKKGTDKLPSWALPLITVLASTILSALGSSQVEGSTLMSTAITGVVGGIAGVGVREGVDQLVTKPTQKMLDIEPAKKPGK